MSFVGCDVPQNFLDDYVKARGSTGAFIAYLYGDDNWEAKLNASKSAASSSVPKDK